MIIVNFCGWFHFKGKSDVESVLEKFFYNMVHTQILAKNTLTIILEIFSWKGDYSSKFVHQHSTIKWVAERKNKHVLEITRLLMFSTNIPKYLWGEALLTVAFLINRMSSKFLNLKAHLSVLACFPSSLLYHDLPLKVFDALHLCTFLTKIKVSLILSS